MTEDDFKKLQERVKSKALPVKVSPVKKIQKPLAYTPVFERDIRPLYTRKVRFDIEPMGAPRMVRSDKWKKREVVTRYFAFKDEFRRQCAEKNWVLGPALIGYIYIAMPDSWSKAKKAAMLGSLHQQKPDADNFCKATMDAFGTDDSHVAVMDVVKVWSNESYMVLMAPPL